MSTLAEMKEAYMQGVANAKHLLIIGPTKAGKSDYVAEAARDGFPVLYIDNDNGLGTLMEALKDDPAALSRIHYFRPPDMMKFVIDLLTLGVFRWNITRNMAFSSASVKPEDKCVEFFPQKFPMNMILSIDTWTTLSFSAVKNAAKSQNIDMSEIDSSGLGRELYGPAGLKLTHIATILQQAAFHTIVQAHPSVYERKEKPTGSTVSQTKEKDMIIKEVIDIPMSSSNPHGYNLGKFFNEIGWLRITKNMGRRELDFEASPTRISGGSVSTKGDPRTSHRFSKLFFPQGVPAADTSESIIYFTGEEWAARKSAQTPAASSTATPSKPAAVIPSTSPNGQVQPNNGMKIKLGKG